MTDAIRRAITARAHAREIQGLAIEQSMRVMDLHGVPKSLAGATTIEEVMGAVPVEGERQRRPIPH